ncbi:S-adenosyl-L-methionine-dependent methyltransferase [Jimgerdemannia flammicorona]|uniref:S-adenosyl-L-methionine-dependent methyltransferase n=1 Tax=Jimgerdemannia flammicorona TaxID=994334 RepID=A0A433QQZ4_9FUNG|nr:S-adenosyl-L-methionine-dependent methyltransferase [Jimgerdemannia flammicorona]
MTIASLDTTPASDATVNHVNHAPRHPHARPVGSDSYIWIDGRGFPKTGNPKYLLPNDDIECQRLTTQHYILGRVIKSPYRAPITEALEKGIKVLNVGCGPGAWSKELAVRFPFSTFVATDIADVFNATGSPPNVTFIVADTFKLPFEDESFDYVFQRFHCLCFTEAAWPTIIRELMRVTKPGGTLELVEISCTIHDAGPVTTTYFEKLRMTMLMRGVNSNYAPLLGGTMTSEGLENVKHEQVKWNIGWGHPELGRLTTENTAATFGGLKPQMLLVLGLDEEEYDQTVREAIKELSGAYPSYWTIECFHGTKPDPDCDAPER